MFIEWELLLVEIWVLIALAALIGLIAGWLIWGGRADHGADADEVRRLRAELDRERARSRSTASDPLDDVPAMAGGGYTRPTQMSPPPTPIDPATVAASPEPMFETGSVVDPEPEIEVTPEPAPEAHPTAEQTAGVKPTGLDAARDGLPDDLRKINGVGRKLETLCNVLGVYHFDQIAGWTEDEIAWVDANLEGFKGRVTRDEWVAQAKALASNETTTFKRRMD